MHTLILLLIACASDPVAEGAPSTPEAQASRSSSDTPAAATAKTTDSATTVELDLCGRPLSMTLSPPGAGTSDPGAYTIVPGAQVGLVRIGHPVTAEALRAYGWVGTWEGGPLTWFDLPANLSPEEFVTRVQPSYHCEGLGGDGLISVEGGVVTAATLHDDRFTASNGVGPGSSLAETRDWLCTERCEETPMMIGVDLIISADGVSASFIDEAVYQITVTAETGAGTGDATERKQRDRNTGKAGRGGKSKRGR